MRTEINWDELAPLVEALLAVVDEPGATIKTTAAISIYPNTLNLTLAGRLGLGDRLLTYRIVYPEIDKGVPA